jgi:hypothetical protein
LKTTVEPHTLNKTTLHHSPIGDYGRHILLSRLPKLSDRHREQLLHTAEHTKGVVESILTKGNDLICYFNPEVTAGELEIFVSKLLNRIAHQVGRLLKLARRAERQSNRSRQRGTPRFQKNRAKVSHQAALVTT